MKVLDIRMVFLDIDGTLYTEGQLIDSAVQAVQQLHRKNIPVSLCTGRSYIHAKNIQSALQIQNGVYFNGSLAIAQQKTVYSTPFSTETTQSLIDLLQQYGHPFIMHTDSRVLSFNQDYLPYKEILDAFHFPEIEILLEDQWDIHSYPIYQFNGFFEKDWDSLIEQSATDCFVYRWDNQAVDLQILHSDKHLGALSILHEYKIDPQHALHIGDGGNDIGMFHALGYSVAMGNASVDIQNEAKMVTLPAEEDGVYHALRNLKLIE
ncbi:HAD family hydrolase [Alicyclobacillus tolerans]|uniref:HAD family hydrolase n=1 Tax=Alicyclobacillus tolerans TaxID=90970 RepID=UPI003B8215C1